MKAEHWKKDKICPVCGKEFKGTAKAQVCGSTCRSRLKRMVEVGKKPEFYLMAKSRGQKLPAITPAEKMIEKQSAKIVLDIKKGYEESIWGGSPTIIAQKEEKPSLTLEQRIAHNSEIDRKITEISKEKLPPGMLPKAHIMDKEIRTEELERQKYNI